MITFCIIVLILAIAGVVFEIIFGDAIIGITLLVLIIKKIFFNKKNKDK